MGNTSKKIFRHIICSILILSLVIIGISNLPIITALAGASAKDVSGSLSNIKISITKTSDDTSTVTDNSVVGSLSKGEHYKVTINWSIEASKYENIVKGGDYFTINLDEQYFTFKNSTQEYNLDYLGYTIGKWKIEDSKIKCTFTDECERFIEVSGFFEASGYFIDENRATNIVKIGNVQLNIPMNPPATGFPYKDEPAIDWNYGLITKLGNHYANDSYMSWYIYGNYDNALKLYTGQTPENLENVVIKDILPDDLIVESIIINTPINHPKNETVLSDKSAFKLSITEQFTHVNEDTIIGGNSFSSQSDWETYINSTPLTYGMSKDKKVALINLGNLPGALKMAETENEFKDKLEDEYIHFSTEELNALANIYKISDSNPYPVYAFQICLKVKSSNTDGIFSKTSYTNTAYLTTTNGLEDDDFHPLNITQVGAGIQGSFANLSSEESSSVNDETSSTEESTSEERTSVENITSSTETTTASIKNLQPEVTTIKKAETVNKPGDNAGTYKWFIMAGMSILILSALFLTEKKNETV